MNVNTDQILQDDYESPPEQESANGVKRKAEDGGQPQQRAKRNRYISIACNECKRRKIKCNGQVPCQRCGNMNLECVYAPNCCNGFKDSQEYKDMTNTVSNLQQQVSILFQDINDLRAHIGSGATMPGPLQQHTPIDPTLQPPPYPPHRPSHPPPSASPSAPVASMSPTASRPKSQSQNTHATFRGPTSADFNFGVAKSSLKQMGMITGQSDITRDGSGDADTETREPSPGCTPPPLPTVQSFHADKDPLWMIPQDEALRLCRVYEDEMGLMYPLLDINSIIAYARHLYMFMEAAHRSGLMQQGLPGTDAIDDAKTSILKLIIAIGLTIEATGRSELGRKLFEFVQPAVDSCLLGNVGLEAVQLLAMAAMFEFHSDRESNSWRIVGFAARLCIELGLHRKETYAAMSDEPDKISGKSRRYEAILVFWSIYVLDRRWSFGTGMPFALQDADVDAGIPKPEGRSPYLNAMIEHYAIAAKVWRFVTNTTSTSVPIDTDQMKKLDTQLVQWHKKVPQHLYFDSSQIGRVPTTGAQSQSRVGRRLPLLLYLRRNLMRITVYRPVLHMATSIQQHPDIAHKVVDIAKDTLRLLTHIKQTSDLYDTQQMLFNAFLTSAMAALFLAVAHMPADFADSVREEYFMGTELVRGFSKDSYVGKRLWKQVRFTIEIAPRLGLASKDQRQNRRGSSHQIKGELDRNRSAAVAMAGLAGHNVDETALFQGSSSTQTWPSEPGASTSPDALANDLQNLFEAAGSYQPMGNGGIGGGSSNDVIFGPSSNGSDGVDYGEDGLASIFRELF